MRSLWLVPSVFITKMSVFPVRFESNTIFFPSGDQAGRWSLESGLFVRFDFADPSAFMLQISSFPSRFVSKAIRSPFGDHVGSVFMAVPEVSLWTSVPSEFMT